MPGRVSWLRCCAPSTAGIRLNTVTTERRRISAPGVTRSTACLRGRRGLRAAARSPRRPRRHAVDLVTPGADMRLRSVVTVLSLIPAVLGAQQRSQDTRPGIAVLPFNNGGSYGQQKEDFDALERGIAGMMISELSANAAARVVERAEIQKLLDEQNLGAQGRVDAATAAKIGKLIGARYMVMGTFVDFYGDFRVDVRL